MARCWGEAMTERCTHTDTASELRETHSKALKTVAKKVLVLPFAFVEYIEISNLQAHKNRTKQVVDLLTVYIKCL